jgi:homopolymeric O-antigen transport system permease protein
MMPPTVNNLISSSEEMEDRAAVRPTLGRTLRALGQYGHLLRNLVVKDLKLKYRGSALGFVWSLANPLLMIAVYTIAFKYILQVRTPGFVFYLMLGILAWTFFANAIAMSSGAIVDSGGLVRSVWFPRAILPFATVLFNFAQYLLTAAVFLPVLMVLYHKPPATPALAYPIFLLLQLIFTAGLALLLSVATAFFRDVRHLVDVALAILFWATPIVYETTLLPPRARTLILLSPLSPYVTAYHDIFYYQRWPAAEVWGLAALYAALTFSAGLWLMTRNEDRLTEQV